MCPRHVATLTPMLDLIVNRWLRLPLILIMKPSLLEQVVTGVRQIKWPLNVSFFFCPFFSKSKKVIVIEQQEASLLKAQKAERQALRKKKALQRAKQRAELPSDGEGEYEPRDTATVSFLYSFIYFTNGLILSLPQVR